MYLKLLGHGLDRAFFKFHVLQRGEMKYLAQTPHRRMMFTDFGPHAGRYSPLGAEVLAIRFSGRESA